MSPKTTKDAVIALLETQIIDLKTNASPVSDYYLTRSGKYQFDITDDEINALLDPETVGKLQKWRMERCPNKPSEPSQK